MSRKVEYNVVRVFYLVALVSLALYLISPFLAPIIFGGTIALALFPLLQRLEHKGWSRKKAAGILTSAFAVLVSVPFFFFVVKGTLAVTEQLQKYSEDARFKDKGMKSIINTLKNDVLLKVQSFAERFGIQPYFTEQRLDTYFAKANSMLLAFFQSVAANLPTIFLFFLVMVICTYSFLKNADNVRHAAQRTLGFNDEKMDNLVRIFIADSRSVYVSNLATGGMQSAIVATAAALCGIGDFFLVFFITLIFSFIPVIGAAPVAFLLALIAFIQGEKGVALIMLAVGSFAGVADNFLRPFLASKGKSGIPTIAAFIFVVGGALLLGFPGLFIGLLVGSFAWDTLPLFWDELARVRPSEPRMIARRPKEEGPPLHWQQ